MLTPHPIFFENDRTPHPAWWGGMRETPSPLVSRGPLLPRYG